MKVVLLQDIKKLGIKGAIKDVSEGYFRNFLAPKKLAAQATYGKVAHIHAQQERAVQKLEVMKESAEAIKTKIDGKLITITEKASETGKLYAAVSSKELAEEIKKTFKVDVPVSTIKMDTIKNTGEYNVTLNLYKGVEALLNVNVTPE